MTDAKSLAEKEVMRMNEVSQDDVGEFATDINLYLAGFKAALECKEVKAMRDAVATWKNQVEQHGGDYLPGNFKQLASALQAFDKLAKGEMCTKD